MQRLLAYVGIALTAFVLGAHPISAKAADSLYRITDVNVDKTGKNATEARNKAMDEGQLQAFYTLFKRIAASGSSTPKVSPQDITPMVKGVEVQQEQISGSRYRAIITVSFNPEYIQDFLRDKSISAPIQSSTSVLLIPIFEKGRNVMLWDKTNPWWAAWTTLSANSAVIRLVLPLGDVDDIAAATLDTLRFGSYDHVRELAGRYNVSEVVVVYAKYDPVSDSSLRVSVRALKEGDTQTQQANFATSASQSIESVLNAAAQEILRRMENSRKSRSASTQGGMKLSITVPLSNVQEWVGIKKRLSELTFLDQLEVTSLTSDRAVISVAYRGDLNGLLNEFSQHQFFLAEENRQMILKSSL
ncbi:MAG: hypothetical protein K0R63_248 [Rickettsiales bacterium]|jgi:hypothetical protein|nr:hypothetical protein [Rickettsiales bacterium]